MGRRYILPENLFGENAGGIERVKRLQVYAKIEGTNVYLNSGFIELYSSISILSYFYFLTGDSVQNKGFKRRKTLANYDTSLVPGDFHS